MKFRELTSIAHNIADSLASGLGIPIGVYCTDIFNEAERSPERYILVDFVSGTTSGGQTSDTLARAISLYAGAFADLCRRHGAEAATFRELTARYFWDSGSPCFVVTVVDHRGRQSVDQYRGMPGARVRELDHLGRPRRRRGAISKTGD